MRNLIYKKFKLKQNSTNISNEIIAGVTIFLAITYILVVTPDTIVGKNSNLWDSIFIGTAISACITTMLIGIFTNMPFALAPGLGLSAQFALMLSSNGGYYSIGGAIAIIFIAGVVFFLLCVLKLKNIIFNSIPASIREAIPIGIGFFILIIGLINCGAIKFVSEGTSLFGIECFFPHLVNTNIVANNKAGLSALAMFIGLISIFVLSHYKIKGSILISIILVTIIGIPMGLTDLSMVSHGWNFVDRIVNYFSFDKNKSVFLDLDFYNIFRSTKFIIPTLIFILTFSMINIFDTFGTLAGITANTPLVNEKGEMRDFDKVLFVDSVNTVVGAFCGVSTMTTFLECGAGIDSGARTGLTAVTISILFFISIFIEPIFSIIPTAASSSVLVYIGILIIQNLKNFEFNSVKNDVPALITIIMMPFCYSISDGIGLGIITYVILNFLFYIIDYIIYKVKKTEKPKNHISLAMLIFSLIFLIMFLVPTT